MKQGITQVMGGNRQFTCKPFGSRRLPCSVVQPDPGIFVFFGENPKMGWFWKKTKETCCCLLRLTLPETNIAMGNPPFEDVSPIENGGIPLLC